MGDAPGPPARKEMVSVANGPPGPRLAKERERNASLGGRCPRALEAPSPQGLAETCAGQPSRSEKSNIWLPRAWRPTGFWMGLQGPIGELCERGKEKQKATNREAANQRLAARQRCRPRLVAVFLSFAQAHPRVAGSLSHRNLWGEAPGGARKNTRPSLVSVGGARDSEDLPAITNDFLFHLPA